MALATTCSILDISQGQAYYYPVNINEAARLPGAYFATTPGAMWCGVKPGWNKDYQRIQILTIEELLHSAEVKMPPQFGTFKQAQQTADAEQLRLGLG